jgi:hypothetical protein
MIDELFVNTIVNLIKRNLTLSNVNNAIKQYENDIEVYKGNGTVPTLKHIVQVLKVIKRKMVIKKLLSPD